MSRWAIIDFSGYYYDRKFLIKEICIYKKLLVNRTRIILWITRPPVTYLNREGRRTYRDYYQEYGIPWRRGDYEIHRLMIELFQLLLRGYRIYVKSTTKFRQLESFMNINIDLPIQILDNFGFYENIPVSKSVCSFHYKRLPRYYCASVNAEKMFKWFTEMPNLTYVIDFNGYYNGNNQFIIKEISIYGLNNNGSIEHHNLFVAKLPSGNLSDSSNLSNSYDRNYYEKYGIDRTSGTHDLAYLLTIVKNIFSLTSEKSYIFVKNENNRYELRKIIDESKTILCLNKLNYKEQITIGSLNTDCIYHTSGNIYRNMCADFRARMMVEWIVKMEYYKYENITGKILFDVALLRERNMFYNHQ